jgi:hypothetical protein
LCGHRITAKSVRNVGILTVAMCGELLACRKTCRLMMSTGFHGIVRRGITRKWCEAYYKNLLMSAHIQSHLKTRPHAHAPALVWPVLQIATAARRMHFSVPHSLLLETGRPDLLEITKGLRAGISAPSALSCCCCTRHASGAAIFLLLRRKHGDTSRRGARGRGICGGDLGVE